MRESHSGLSTTRQSLYRLMMETAIAEAVFTTV